MNILSKISLEHYHLQSIVVTKNQFMMMYVVGKGGFGRVWKVQEGDTNFAMKEMSKQRILAKKSVNSVLNERNLLSKLHHDFMVNMKYAFQDRHNLYLVMDYLGGGDLRYHI
jgi:protein kinase A